MRERDSQRETPNPAADFFRCRCFDPRVLAARWSTSLAPKPRTIFSGRVARRPFAVGILRASPLKRPALLGTHRDSGAGF